MTIEALRLTPTDMCAGSRIRNTNIVDIYIRIPFVSESFIVIRRTG